MGALGAIAAGHRPPSGWPEWAAGRFGRAEWAERQFLLGALAVCEGRLTVEILRAAEEDWSNAPIIKEVARFVDARVAAGETVTAEPLVRYTSGARTGRIDRVLAGDFDLIAESALPD